MPRTYNVPDGEFVFEDFLPANYFVGAFQWGNLSHEQAMRSIELFTNEVMPHYTG